MKLVQPLNRLRANGGVLLGLSIALHGSLLLLPVRWLSIAETTEPSLEPEELPESGAIALTTLPPIAQPAAPAEPVEVAPPESLPEPEPPPLVQVPPAVAEIPQVVETPEREPEPEPDSQPEPEPEPTNTEPEAGIAVRFSNDFPHVAGAASGCFGLENCRTIAGETFRDVAKAIREGLEAKGYELTPEDNGDESGGNHRIYRMISPPDNQVKYLNIFGEGLTGAFYLITSDPIKRGDLEALDLGMTL